MTETNNPPGADIVIIEGNNPSEITIEEPVIDEQPPTPSEEDIPAESTFTELTLVNVRSLFARLSIDRQTRVGDFKKEFGTEFYGSSSQRIRFYTIKPLAMLMLVVELTPDQIGVGEEGLLVVSWFGITPMKHLDFDRPFKAAGFAMINERVDGELLYTFANMIL